MGGQLAPDDELRDARARFVRYLDSRLVGPVDGENEEFAGTPLLRYMMGMLFPNAGEEVELVDDGTGNDDQSADEDADDPASSASHRPLPSSLGLSFLVGPGATLECEVCAAMYDQKPGGSKGGRGSKQWKRRPLPKTTVFTVWLWSLRSRRALNVVFPALICTVALLPSAPSWPSINVPPATVVLPV